MPCTTPRLKSAQPAVLRIGSASGSFLKSGSFACHLSKGIHFRRVRDVQTLLAVLKVINGYVYRDNITAQFYGCNFQLQATALEFSDCR